MLWFDSYLVLCVSSFFKATLSAAEEKLTQSQSDAKQLKITVKQHESQMDKYKSKVKSTYQNVGCIFIMMSQVYYVLFSIKSRFRNGK